jgi:hypothetical protein
MIQLAGPQLGDEVAPPRVVHDLHMVPNSFSACRQSCSRALEWTSIIHRMPGKRSNPAAPESKSCSPPSMSTLIRQGGTIFGTMESRVVSSSATPAPTFCATSSSRRSRGQIVERKVFLQLADAIWRWLERINFMSGSARKKIQRIGPVIGPHVDRGVDSAREPANPTGQLSFVQAEPALTVMRQIQLHRESAEQTETNASWRPPGGKHPRLQLRFQSAILAEAKSHGAIHSGAAKTRASRAAIARSRNPPN